CVRDYIHVSDLARAHLKALQYLEGGGQGLAVNLGTGQGVSIREIVQAVIRVTSRPVPAVFRARRPGDPAELYADPSKARAHLGFVPELSDIDTIVRTAAPFFGLRTKPETLPPSKAAASAR
ncbi:MAG: UDP-glucose 4-epimerase, partial [Mesorhizobium sp.]